MKVERGKKRNKDGNASAIPAYQRGANQRRCCQRNGNLTPLDGKSLSTLALSARHHPHHPATHNMMRQQLLRSLPRSQRLASINATRAFSSSAPRPAEVELTIGTPKHQQAPTTLSDGNWLTRAFRWQEGLNRRYASNYHCLIPSPRLTRCSQPAPPSSRPAKRPAPPSPATATTRSS